MELCSVCLFSKKGLGFIKEIQDWGARYSAILISLMMFAYVSACNLDNLLLTNP